MTFCETGCGSGCDQPKKDIDANTSNFNKAFNVKTLTMNITNNCNLACSYCFEEHTKDKMSVEDSIKILDTVYANFLINHNPSKEKMGIAFFGGEPLLNFEVIKAVVERAKEKKYSIAPGITTNLTLLTDEMMEYFDENEIQLLVSIDGTKEIHDRNRSNSYDRVAKNVKRMIDVGLAHLMEARMTVSPNTVEHLLEGVKNIYSLGFEFVAPVVITDQVWTQEQLAIQKDQMDKMFEFMLNLYDWHENKRNFGNKMVDEALEACMVGSIKVKTFNVPCSAWSNRSLSIGCDGTIMPCHQRHTITTHVEEVTLGNIFTDEINTEKIHDIVPLSWENAPESNYKCETCPAKTLCHGGCPSENLTLYNNMMVVPPAYCDWLNNTKLLAEKYQEKIFNAKNVRHHRIHVLKINLDMQKFLEDLLHNTTYSDSTTVEKITMFYGMLVENKDKLIPSFKQYFSARMNILLKNIDTIKKEAKI